MWQHPWYDDDIDADDDDDDIYTNKCITTKRERQ